MGRLKENKDVDLTEEEMADQAINDAESDEEQKLYKKRKWQHKLKLGDHYRMERFTWMFGTLMVLLVLFGFTGWNKDRIAQKEQIGTQAKYTEQIEFSLSGIQGNIRNVFRDTSGKRAFILIEMNDVSDLSLDASKYQLYLTGLNNTKLKQEPASSMFIFGSSGYMGIEFYDDRGLENEIYQMTLRNNSELTDEAELSEQDLDNLDDASFGKYDQAEFYSNVGAEDAVTMDVLDKELSPVQLYYSLVGHFEEDEVYEEIDSTIKDLDKLLAREQEYSNRIVELGYEAPDIPGYMDGDYVTDENEFRPRTNVLGSHDLDYENNRIPDGFLSQVVDDSSEFRDYMAKKRADEEIAKSENDDEYEEFEGIEELTIKGTDKKIVLGEFSMEDATSNEQSMMSAVEELNKTRDAYLDTKRHLQIELMRELLLLEADVHTQSNAFSTHDGDSFLNIW